MMRPGRMEGMRKPRWLKIISPKGYNPKFVECCGRLNNQPFVEVYQLSDYFYGTRSYMTLRNPKECEKVAKKLLECAKWMRSKKR